jgi:signal transduction histidine kinase
MYRVSLVGLLMLFSSLFVFSLSLIVLKKRHEGCAKNLAVLLFFLGIYSFGTGMEVMSPDYSNAMFWVRLEYIGIAFLPFSLLTFCLQYFGLVLNNTLKSMLRILFGLSFFIFFAHATHTLHPYFYTDVNVSIVSNLTILSFTKGPIYYLSQFITISSFLLVFGLSVRLAIEEHAWYRNRALALISSSIGPLVLYIFYQLGLTPYGLDIVPIAFALSAIILGFVFLNESLFGPFPIASHLIIEALGSASIILDRKDRVVGFNQTALTWFPQLENKVIGLRVQELFPRIPELSSLAESNFTNSGEWSIIPTPSGLPIDRYLNVQVSPIQYYGNIGTSLLISDVTESHLMTMALQDTNTQLKQSNAMKDMVIGVMSHDLRSPLLAVRNLQNIMMDERVHRNPKKFHILKEELDSLIFRADLLIRNLVALSSLGNDGNECQSFPVSMETLLHAVKGEAETLAKRKNIDFQITMEEDVVVLGNDEMLVVVLRNLLDNAFKYSPIGGKVELSVDIERQHVKLSIVDEGNGIPQWVQQEIANGKWGVSLPGTQGEKGPGIGLYASIHFLKLQDINLEIKDSLGGGSRLSFEIPRFQRNALHVRSDDFGVKTK